MAEVVLTIVDTAGIQDYIFGSNRLRENIGASYLVKQAAGAWVCDMLPVPNNILDKKKCAIDAGKQIVTSDLAAELVYAGGGNAVILFRSPDEARTFARDLSRKVLIEAPGLEIVIVHSAPFEWPSAAKILPDQVKKLYDGRLAQKKRTRQATLTPLLGLGVTAECAATGLVASHFIEDPTPRFVSDEIRAKSKISGTAKNKLKADFASADPQGQFDFSDELDHLSRTGGEESYIAVVHIDGNDVGALFVNCGKDATNDRDYINRLRLLSDSLKQASDRAIIEMLKQLASPSHLMKREKKTEGDEDVWELKEALPKFVTEDRRVETQRKQIVLYADDKEKNPNPKPYWPVIPLVYGGDDLTFVCNGQLGLSLATICMKEFTAQTRKLLGNPVYTGAGVGIVKVHYPFRRAYDLSASLATSAKKMLRAKGMEEVRQASALDWHISSTGLSGDLGAIRSREYTVLIPDGAHKKKSGSLLMRPLWLSHEKENRWREEWRTWRNFNHLVGEFNFARQWAGRRNKLKALREALRVGEPAVEEFRKTYLRGGESELPQPEGAQSNQDLRNKSWVDDRCIYFDVIEAMDHHFLLEESSNAGNDSAK